MPETRGIPIVMLTASVQASDQQRFAVPAADGEIIKPFDPARLADQIEQLVGLK